MARYGARISRHELAVVAVLAAEPQRWFTNAEIADLAEPKVSERTVRGFTRVMSDGGLLEVMPIFPALKYRLSSNPPKELWKRLTDAAVVCGIIFGASS